MSIIETTLSKYPNKDQNRDIGFEIIAGAICLIVGLVLIIMRGEITMEAVGTEQILIDAFSGKGSTSINTFLMVVTIIGSVTMIVGVVMLFFAITTFSSKSVNIVDRTTIDPNVQETFTGTKQCPFCAETIKISAIKCRFCGEKSYDRK